MRMTDKTATRTKGPDPFDVQVTGAMSVSLRRCVFYLTFAEYHLFLKQPVGCKKRRRRMRMLINTVIKHELNLIRAAAETDFWNVYLNGNHAR